MSLRHDFHPRYLKNYGTEDRAVAAIEKCIDDACRADVHEYFVAAQGGRFYGIIRIRRDANPGYWIGRGFLITN